MSKREITNAKELAAACAADGINLPKVVAPVEVVIEYESMGKWYVWRTAKSRKEAKQFIETRGNSTSVCRIRERKAVAPTPEPAKEFHELITWICERARFSINGAFAVELRERVAHLAGGASQERKP